MGGLLWRWRGLIVLVALVGLVAAALLTAGLIRVGAASAHLVARGPGVVAGQDGRGPQPVDADAAVGQGSWIATPAGASASLTFGDGSRVVVAGSSRVRIAQLDQDWSGTLDVALDLEKGMAWTTVPPGHGTFSWLGVRPGSRATGTATAYLVVAGGEPVGAPVRVDLIQGTLVVHAGAGGPVWQFQSGQAVTFKSDGTQGPAAIPEEDAASPFLVENLRYLAEPSANLNTP